MSNHRKALFSAIVISLLGAGCSADGGSAKDTSPTDGGSADGGASDSGSDDVGSTDAGSADAGSADAGSVDAGSGDAGSGDAGAVDAGPPPKRPESADKIAIAGVWQSSFGGNETVADKAWSAGTGNTEVVEFDNAGRWVITRNPDDAKYNPGKFNKVVWTNPEVVDAGGWKARVFHYCWVDFGLDTAALAKASTHTADDSEPEKSGCGKFPWTRLSSLETVGSWKTNFGGAEEINTHAWSFAWLRAFDNGKNEAFTQNPADAKYNPGAFNKVVWTDAKAGAWHYCIVDFGLPTLDAARKTAKKADASDPGKKGCGGFGWTKMSAK